MIYVQMASNIVYLQLALRC